MEGDVRGNPRIGGPGGGWPGENGRHADPGGPGERPLYWKRGCLHRLGKAIVPPKGPKPRLREMYGLH